MSTTRKFIFSFLLPAGLSLSAIAGEDQDSLGLPGDHLDLYGTLELFKKSNSLEEFEKSLNSESSKLNNMDLDGNGKVDYIRVEDHMESEAHAIRLTIDVSKTEKQDVAVIEIEKKKDGTAHLQIVGDEDMYGKDYIVEPKEDSEGPKSSLMEREDFYADPREPGIVLVNVWGWPCVRFIYAPAYVVWVSPWYWGYYPGWWYGWAPSPWHIYRKHHWHCRGYHHRVHVHHMHHAHKVYHHHRKTSPTVYKKHHGHHGGGTVKPGPHGHKDGPSPNPQPGPKTGPKQKQTSPSPGPQQKGPKTGPGPKKNSGPKSQPGPKSGPKGKR